MKNTKSKAEEYAEQSGEKFILAAQNSDKKNADCSPELRAINRLAAILGAWVNEPRTDEAWQFYQNYDSPCTNRMLHCSSDIQKTCVKLRYAGKGDLESMIEERWQQVVEYADKADDNISRLRRQYHQGTIDKKGFAERIKRKADSPRYIAAGLQGMLELIAKESWQVPAKKDSGKAVDIGKRKKKLEPLSANEAAVYELLKSLPEHRGMKGRDILSALEKQTPRIFIDQSTLTKNIIPKLRPYGVKNKRGAGYYISK